MTSLSCVDYVFKLCEEVVFKFIRFKIDLVPLKILLIVTSV